MVIRILNEADIIPCDLLLLADPSKSQIDSYLNDSTAFVGEGDGQVIAVAVVAEISKYCCEIKNLAVNESFQQKGYGKQMLNYCCSYAKQNGFDKIRIATANSSMGQLALYQKLGFDIIDINRDFFINNYEMEIVENGIRAKHLIILEKNIAL